MPSVNNTLSFDSNTFLLNNNNGKPTVKKTRNKINRTTSLVQSSETKLPSICTFTKIKPKPTGKNAINKQTPVNLDQPSENIQNLGVLPSSPSVLSRDNSETTQYTTDLTSNEMEWTDTDFLSFFPPTFSSNADEFSLNFDTFEPNAVYQTNVNQYTPQSSSAPQIQKQLPMSSSTLPVNNQVIFENPVNTQQTNADQQYANSIVNTTEFNLFLNPSMANDSNCNPNTYSTTLTMNNTAANNTSYYVESVGSPWEFDADFNTQFSYIESSIV